MGEDREGIGQVEGPVAVGERTVEVGVAVRAVDGRPPEVVPVPQDPADVAAEVEDRAQVFEGGRVARVSYRNPRIDHPDR